MKPPIEVYADLDGVWSIVLLIDFNTMHVTLDRNGKQIMLPVASVLKRDLVWPNGRSIDIQQISVQTI